MQNAREPSPTQEGGAPGNRDLRPDAGLERRRANTWLPEPIDVSSPPDGSQPAPEGLQEQLGAQQEADEEVHHLWSVLTAAIKRIDALSVGAVALRADMEDSFAAISQGQRQINRELQKHLLASGPDQR